MIRWLQTALAYSQSRQRPVPEEPYRSLPTDGNSFGVWSVFRD